MNLTLGSLFDGSGGFPLAAKNVGIHPIWASEIEPFPVRVTTKRLPDVKHFGDIRGLSGATLPPVDIVTFGSPCQDLSVAGKRAGIQGARSNLFYEAIRIIQEMRCKTNGQYPKYAVWENVPGAFSSNKGQDFKTVLESFCQLKGHSLPPTRPNKWHSAGEIVADDFSLAWRVLDAQYFGVPQRRKRIFLVADLTDTRAGQILFESESLSRNLGPCECEGKTTARSLETSTNPTNKCELNDKECDHVSLVFDNHAQDARYTRIHDICPTITTRYGTGGNTQPLVISQIPKAYAIAGKHKRAMFSGVKNTECTTHIARTIDTRGVDPCCNQGGMAILCQANSVDDYAVRRLTPIECARLQGFPADWCDDLDDDDPSPETVELFIQLFSMIGSKKTEKQIRRWLQKPYSDSAAYKMWGNGVALPCVEYVLNKIKNQEELNI